jgi:hypothetical protein
MVGIGAASIALLYAGCLIGKRVFIEKLIHDYESGCLNDAILAYESLNKRKHGHLIYELTIECVGD